jgi:lysozyme family protein
MSATVSAFDLCFDVTIGHEGGYSNDPNDPGGETNWGVSKRAYPNLDIKNLTKDQAKSQVYKPDYWDKIGGDLLHPAVACIAFDAAVNNGVTRAKTWLQQAACVTVDGSIGPITAKAANSNPAATLTNAHARRMAFMTGLQTWQTFGIAQDGGPGGWSTRLAALPWQASQIALQLGAGGPSA